MSYICPFCNSTFPLIYDTHNAIKCTFNTGRSVYSKDSYNKDLLILHIYKCPSCEKISVAIKGLENFKQIYMPIVPNSLSKKFPEFIPLFIRSDYEEAYSILNLSPKASATLSRRCLQGMIRDFWGISKSRLFDEINELKNIVPAAQWRVIDAIRSIGNIGAHMEKDVNVIVDIEPSEAEQLLKLIELLIDKWYIQRNDEQELFNQITQINNNKNSLKNIKS